MVRKAEEWVVEEGRTVDAMQRCDVLENNGDNGVVKASKESRLLAGVRWVLCVVVLADARGMHSVCMVCRVWELGQPGRGRQGKDAKRCEQR